MCGLKPKSTMHTIEDARRGRRTWAPSVYKVDLPFFHRPNQDDYIRFYTDLSESIDIGIMVYNTYWFGAEPITPETLLRLAATTEHVVAAKWKSPGPAVFARIPEFADEINFIDASDKLVWAHELGAKGLVCWLARVYPPYDFHLWDLLESHRYDEARVLVAKFDDLIGAGSLRATKCPAATDGRKQG